MLKNAGVAGYSEIFWHTQSKKWTGQDGAVVFL